MQTTIIKRGLAALACGASVLGGGMSLAQTYGGSGVIPFPQGYVNPTLAARNLPMMSPVRPAVSGPAVSMGPSRGPIGTPIQLQVRQNLGASPAILSFKAVVSRGIPARVHTRLSGYGASYSVRAPIQLCIQGGGYWEAELVLSNGRNLGVVGAFTPTNCPR